MNNIDEMWPICHDCPYWEVCEPPYICARTEAKMKEEVVVMTLEHLTIEQRIDLIEKAVCTLIDSISPMNQEIALTNKKIEQLEAICNELQKNNESKECESSHEGGVSDCQGQV